MGDVDRNVLVESHLAYARRVASLYRKRMPFLDRDDLQGEAFLALVQSADRYDPTRGASFRTYAGRRIMGALIDARRAHDPLSRHARARGERLVSVPLPVPEVDRRDWPDTQALFSEIRCLIGRLPAREKFVIERVFFSGDAQCDLVPALGVNFSRVSQLRLRAVRRLRASLSVRASETATGAGCRNCPRF